LDFSSARLFHDPCLRHRLGQELTLGAVSAQLLWSEAQTQSAIQMLVQGDRIAGQAGFPAYPLNLQVQVLELHRVVPIDRTLELQRENLIQIALPAA